MILALPLPPNRANARGHWRKHHRERESYWTACLVAAQNQHKRPPAKPPECVWCGAVLYVHQLMDDDNKTARMKWPLDWLTKRGYIVDDRPAHLKLTVNQVVDRKNQRLELELHW